jgi:hypothetical protein
MRHRLGPMVGVLVGYSLMMSSLGCESYLRAHITDESLKAVGSQIGSAQTELRKRLETLPNPLGEGMLVFIRSETDCGAEYSWIWLNGSTPLYALDARSQALTPRLEVLGQMAAPDSHRIRADASGLRSAIQRRLCGDRRS